MALGFLVSPLRDAMIWLLCSEFRIWVVSEDLAPPCSHVSAMVFGRVLPSSSVSSDHLDDGGSGV